MKLPGNLSKKNLFLFVSLLIIFLLPKKQVLAIDNPPFVYHWVNFDDVVNNFDQVDSFLKDIRADGAIIGNTWPTDAEKIIQANEEYLNTIREAASKLNDARYKVAWWQDFSMMADISHIMSYDDFLIYAENIGKALTKDGNKLATHIFLEDVIHVWAFGRDQWDYTAQSTQLMRDINTKLNQYGYKLTYTPIDDWDVYAWEQQWGHTDNITNYNLKDLFAEDTINSMVAWPDFYVCDSNDQTNTYGCSNCPGPGGIVVVSQPGESPVIPNFGINEINPYCPLDVVRMVPGDQQKVFMVSEFGNTFKSRPGSYIYWGWYGFNQTGIDKGSFAYGYHDDTVRQLNNGDIGVHYYWFAGWGNYPSGYPQGLYYPFGPDFQKAKDELKEIINKIKPLTSTPTPTPIHCQPLGDIDCSQKVNALDLSYLLSVFGTNDPKADLDDSGKVNALDLSILLSNFGKSQ